MRFFDLIKQYCRCNKINYSYQTFPFIDGFEFKFNLRFIAKDPIEVITTDVLLYLKYNDIDGFIAFQRVEGNVFDNAHRLSLEDNYIENKMNNLQFSIIEIYTKELGLWTFIMSFLIKSNGIVQKIK